MLADKFRKLVQQHKRSGKEVANDTLNGAVAGVTRYTFSTRSEMALFNEAINCICQRENLKVLFKGDTYSPKNAVLFVGVATNNTLLVSGPGVFWLSIKLESEFSSEWIRGTNIHKNVNPLFLSFLHNAGFTAYACEFRANDFDTNVYDIVRHDIIPIFGQDEEDNMILPPLVNVRIGIFPSCSGNRKIPSLHSSSVDNLDQDIGGRRSIDNAGAMLAPKKLPDLKSQEIGREVKMLDLDDHKAHDRVHKIETMLKKRPFSLIAAEENNNRSTQDEKVHRRN